MEAEEINNNNNHHGGSNSKRSRSVKIARRDQRDMDEGAAAAAALHPWQQRHPASRIFRVSRGSGGKDRHSKVYTSKGLRDRRVRLSVSTAIQFYDLQDRLGYDQPSKAIEWLIKAADAAIAGLPTLESPFATELEAKPESGDGDQDMMQQQQQQLSKSGCSSTSETSKGSVLSLSRSDSHVKARERARDRTLKDNDHNNVAHQMGSFTELLTGNSSSSNGAVAVTTASQLNSGAQKPFQYMPTANQLLSSGYLGNGSTPIGMVPLPFNIGAAGVHPELQHFSFSQDHAAIPIAAVGPQGDYNLNFSFSPGLAGFNRGTLQSNSPSQLPYHHLPRLPSPADNRSNIPFFFSSAAATPSSENQFPAGLQLCYGDGYRHSDLKGKENNS